MRRPGDPLYNKQYCGNTNKKEVHDLDKETTHCQIEEIIDAGHAKPFDSLEDAYRENYDNCHYCLGGSTR